MRKTSPLIAALMASVALTACASNSNFASPSVPTPAAYAHASATTTASAASQGHWWTAFGDARLERLVDAVVAKNNDLAAAALRVRKAQLQAGIVSNNLIPQVSGGVDGSSRNSDSGATNGESYSASLAASYEVDLWGKLADQRAAANFEAGATEQDREAAALALTGTTVDLYWQLAYQNQRIATADQSLAYARQTLTLVRSQYGAGAVSAVELNEAEQSVRSQESTLAGLTQDRVETRNALTVLLGGDAWSTDDEPQNLAGVTLPSVSAGLPAQLVARRPDLRAAEQRLRSSLATADAATASLYPSLSLTGSLGGSSTALSSLVANPVSVLGVGIDLPFLNWNRVSLTNKSARTDYEIAVASFRTTLLQAFTDVDNALSARTQLAAQGESLDAALTAATRAEQLYSVRYRAGAVPLRTWLDAQEQRRSAELAVAQNSLERANNQVDLYQSLGGDIAAGATGHAD
ncbi:MAG: hypothetical protein BGN86_10995 [Caulobacterales bacterium 68-7]|nr:MAG: hypothetical protein BGN86_10995 [Caulobacterales bacterium 68-7]